MKKHAMYVLLLCNIFGVLYTNPWVPLSSGLMVGTLGCYTAKTGFKAGRFFHSNNPKDGGRFVSAAMEFVVASGLTVGCYGLTSPSSRKSLSFVAGNLLAIGACLYAVCKNRNQAEEEKQL